MALSLLFLLSAMSLKAQADAPMEHDTSNWPSWLRDMRRWEIVAFGSFPFAMFFSTIGMDLHRWNSANGMDWGNRRYAPWPLKSAGAVPMTNSEQRLTIGIAIGLSAGIAVADHLIVQARRRRDRRRAEAIPVGTVIITRIPLAEEQPDGETEYDAPDAFYAETDMENAEAAVPVAPDVSLDTDCHSPSPS